jgi:hypothetical protein
MLKIKETIALNYWLDFNLMSHIAIKRDILLFLCKFALILSKIFSNNELFDTKPT